LNLAILGFEIAVEGSLIAVALLLLVTFLAFTRMNKDVRRARMFIMADRVKRFLGAFTLGFLAIAADSILSIAGVSVPAVSGVVIFLFLASIVYGSLELFFIVRPPRSRLSLSRKAAAARSGLRPGEASAAEDPPEGESHAAR